MKRIIALLLIIVFVSTGCAVVKVRKVDTEYENLEIKDIPYSSKMGRQIKPALYFLQKGTGKLTAELRTITIDGNENPVKEIVSELLKGPYDETLTEICPYGVFVDYVEVSTEIANVYIKSSYDLDSKSRFLIKAAVSNTLIDYLNIKYTNVVINGESQGVDIYPSPLQGITSGIWQESYDEQIGKFVANAPKPESGQEKTIITLKVPLYFFNSSSEYIIPEVREVEFADLNYASKIIQELTKGPRNSYVYSPSINKELSLISKPLFYELDGVSVMELNLSKLPTLTKFESRDNEIKSYSCLCYSLLSFYPNVEKIVINVEDTRVSVIGTDIEISNGVSRKDVQGYLGDSINLYFRIKDSDLLTKVSRMIEQDDVWSADIRLYELMKGPKNSEGQEVWPCFPIGISEQDILGTTTYGSTIEVNLSQNFKDQCAQLSHEQEMLMIYSMVNMLTDMQGINSVQFLVEDKKVDSLSGHIYFRDIFIKNPGLVQIDY